MLRKHGKSWLTPQEVQSKFPIPTSTLYDWCIRGDVETLPGEEVPYDLRVESKYLISWESIEQKFQEAYLGRLR